MKCLLDEEVEPQEVEDLEILKVLSKRCVWNIVRVLNSTNSKMINITALVSMLKANYDYVMKCLELMRRYGMVEMAKIGRLRLVKLNTDNELVSKMISLLSTSSS